MTKKSRLEIILFDINQCCLKDGEGKYFLYCNYKYHKGFVRKDKAKECMKKECWHYTIYREEELDR
jgi:hypothetical protein